MRIAYFDCTSGISGDMTLGALVDAGVDLAAIQAGIDSLGLPSCQLTREEALFTNQKLGQIRSLPRGAAFESPVAKDADYADGRVAAETINRLRDAKKRREENGTPFFIAVGFVRPHLPFSAPKKYWDLHDPTKLPQPMNENAPQGAPAVAVKQGGEIKAYKPVPVAGEISDSLKRKLIHGYYASTSFVDAQIGKLIRAVDRLGLAEDEPRDVLGAPIAQSVLVEPQGAHVHRRGRVRHGYFHLVARGPDGLDHPRALVAVDGGREVLLVEDVAGEQVGVAQARGGVADPDLPRLRIGQLQAVHHPVARGIGAQR